MLISFVICSVPPAAWRSPVGSGHSSPKHKPGSQGKRRGSRAQMMRRWLTAPNSSTPLSTAQLQAPSVVMTSASDPVSPAELALTSGLMYDRSRSNSMPLGMSAVNGPGSLSPVLGSPTDPSFFEKLKQELQHEVEKSSSNDSSLNTGSSTPRATENENVSPATVDGSTRNQSRLLDLTPRLEQCRAEILIVEKERQDMLESRRVIGRQVSGRSGGSSEESEIRAALKQVRFRWRRGNRIGQSRVFPSSSFLSDMGFFSFCNSGALGASAQSLFYFLLPGSAFVFASLV